MMCKNLLTALLLQGIEPRDAWNFSKTSLSAGYSSGRRRCCCSCSSTTTGSRCCCCTRGACRNSRSSSSSSSSLIGSFFKAFELIQNTRSLPNGILCSGKWIIVLLLFLLLVAKKMRLIESIVALLIFIVVKCYKFQSLQARFESSVLREEWHESAINLSKTNNKKRESQQGTKSNDIFYVMNVMNR